MTSTQQDSFTADIEGNAAKIAEAIIDVHGEMDVVIDGQHAYFGSVMSYTLKGLRESVCFTAQQAALSGISIKEFMHVQVVEAMKNARGLGHKIQWVGLHATCLYSDARIQADGLIVA